MSETTRSADAADRPRYDWHKSYRWNYEHPPQPLREDEAPPEVAVVPGDWRFLGIPVGSPLGVAAGPLLNGDWCRYYADLGFDVLTYKTVRSGPRDCYPLPNLQPVVTGPMTGAELRVAPQETMRGAWAVSFGMPSSHPDVWRRDVERTRRALGGDKVLCVSVVGTVQPDWDMQQLAEDYALCARWAVQAGADCVEANFSCPNVSTCDGQLYQNAEQSRLVAAALRDAIGAAPLIIKIGFIPEEESVVPLIESLADLVDALAMTNSIAAKVGANADSLLFDGQQRGICGDAIRHSSISQLRRFRSAIEDASAKVELIGVGGIASADDVLEYLSAGAHACQLATAVMTDPEVGLAIRRELAG